MASFRLVEYLEHQHLWVRLQAQKGQKQRPSFETRRSIIVLRSDGYSLQEDLVQCCVLLPSLALTSIERGVGGPGAQLSKRTSTLKRLI